MSRTESVGRSRPLLAVCLLSLAGALTGCRQDMHDNPKFKPNREGANRQPVAGTVARGSLYLNPAVIEIPKPGTAQPAALPAAAQPAAKAGNAATGTPANAYVGDPNAISDAARRAIPTGEDGFPFKITQAVLDRGESRFNISCRPCHGRLGDGQGMIALRGFRKPPSYHEERLRLAPTGHFYDVMTNGFGAMPSYADQLTPEDRWKVIAYIRVLQLSQYAPVAGLSDADKKKVEEGVKPAAAHGAEKAGGHQ